MSVGGSVLVRPIQRFTTAQRDILLVFACALVLRLAFAALTADTYDYDEFVILLLARDFAHGSVPYRDFMFFHPPGPLVIFRLLQPLIGEWWPLARVFTLFIDSITAVLVWFAGRLLYGRREALAAGLLYAASPLALISAVRVGQDPLITSLLVAGVVLLLAQPSRWAAALAGVCVALAVWVKYPAALFLPVYILAAPRRIGAFLAGGLVAGVSLFAPFLPRAHQLYAQSVTFQRGRWAMPFDQRIYTVTLFWLAVNIFAVAYAARPVLRRLKSAVLPVAGHRFLVAHRAAMSRESASTSNRRPLWLITGFALGGLYFFTPQVYYHYFVPVVAFAALLGAPVVARFGRSTLRAVALAAAALLAGYAAWIDLGGPSPLYITAAHFSSIHSTIRLLDSRTRPGDKVLADRFEYAFLANRKALAHYFWNVGVLVDAHYLERRVSRARAVVLSYGESSGFPAGFTDFLDARYQNVATPATTVWLVPGTGGELVGARGFEPPTSASRTLRATKLRHAPKETTG